MSQVEIRSATNENPDGKHSSQPHKICATLMLFDLRHQETAVFQQVLHRPGVHPIVEERRVLKRSDEQGDDYQCDDDDQTVTLSFAWRPAWDPGENA